MSRFVKYLGVLLVIPLCLSSAFPDDAATPTGSSERFRGLIRDRKEAVKRAEAEAKTRTEETWFCDEKSRINLAVGRRALEIARGNSKDPTSLDALLWVVAGEAAHRDTIGEALELLCRDHLASARISPACDRAFAGMYTAPASVDRFLREVLAKNPHREVRGRACYGLAFFLELRTESIREMERNPEIRLVIERLLRTPENLATWRGRAPEDLDKETESLYERVAAEFADVRDADGRNLGAVAEGQLFRRRGLGIGKLAPEIEGRDADGKRFKLSDYRGKVVVLSFSANWCGPCVKMYPQERALVAKLKSEPFALVGVNADEEVGTLKRSIASGEITWRCWWDGGQDGPITTRWGVTGFPAVFVLDRSGVIRFKDVVGDDLDKAVASLLNEAPTESPPSK